MSDTMTVSELAEVAGVSTKTVRRAIKTIGYDIKNGVTARFEHDQCIRIVGAISSVQRRGHLSKAPRTPVQPEIGKHFTDVLQVMNKLADACLAMAAEVKASRHVIAAPEQEYATVAGYCRRNGIPTDRETAQRYGKIATALSGEMGYPIRKIADERWGEVNTYHIAVLAQAVRQ